MNHRHTRPGFNEFEIYVSSCKRVVKTGHCKQELTRVKKFFEIDRKYQSYIKINYWKHGVAEWCLPVAGRSALIKNHSNR